MRQSKSPILGILVTVFLVIVNLSFASAQEQKPNADYSWVNGKWNGPQYSLELLIKNGNEVSGQGRVAGAGGKAAVRPAITGTVDGDTLNLEFWYPSTNNRVPVVLVRKGNTLVKKSGKISDSTFEKVE
jgi:hypothetical protein